MNPSTSLENQLLATKFYVPVALRTLISRPRLTALLQESLRYSLTLVSAPAGFGKTMLLVAWGKPQPVSDSLVAWVSLDDEDNDPRMFWAAVLTALQMQQSERFTPLLMELHTPQTPPLKYLLRVIINLLVESEDRFLLILDDYHVITEQEVHTTLSYLVEHLPTQLRVVLATRTDPPLPLLQLRARQQLLEVRTDQLRCQEALVLLSADNYFPRIVITWARLYAYYYCINDAETAIQSGLEGISLAQASKQTSLTITVMSVAARYMKESGRLHEALRLVLQVIHLGTQPGRLILPEVGGLLSCKQKSCASGTS